MAQRQRQLSEGPYYKTCETCLDYARADGLAEGKCLLRPHRSRVTRMQTCLQYRPILGANELPERPQSPRHKPGAAVPSQISLDHMDLAIAEVKAERDATIKRVDDKIKALRTEIHELEESRDSYLRGMEASLDILLRMKGERPKNGNRKEELPDLD